MEKSLNRRQYKIYNLLKIEDDVKVNELSQKFNVAEMTIRRDLEKLEEYGLAKRIFGGAILSANTDITFNRRNVLHVKEKQSIGYVAAQYVQNGDSIFIDAGTTTPHFARYLSSSLVISLVTNGVNIVSDIHDSNKETILLGGIYRESTRSLVGPITQSHLDNLYFDKVFLSASGFSVEKGFTNSNSLEVQIKQKVIKQSNQVNLLIDSSKFEKNYLHKIGNLHDIHRIFTEKVPPDNQKKAIEQSGVELVICDTFLQ
ncbi:DeoR/GlpR family DNA-binding transcription regulator [Gracilibacillus suaedae]|uniref:DeoR/GlpR family DNA-binding transcription regulator n=1 Tax=Gracilibacillus suaedae TaxID=2820273 RepID=UPI001ABDCE8E|nr:DeoR/GlpR family DNA-binding transcription regulator [Gracilibacillus suaedae]